MKMKTAIRLRDIYNQIEECEPDISTERLLCQTADQHNVIYGTQFNNADTVEALILTGELRAALRATPAVGSGEETP